MRRGEEGALVLPLLPEGTAPVAHTQQHIIKEGGALQADDGAVVASHTRLAVVRMLITLHLQCHLFQPYLCVLAASADPVDPQENAEKSGCVFTPCSVHTVER